MELKNALLIILKILISTMFVIQHWGCCVDAAVLMGGHIDNKNSTNLDNFYDDYDYTESSEVPKTAQPLNKANSEEIPNPSPLVLPGYNLPENIFNHGKPFYVEKDPLTGKIDFDHKSPSLKSDESDLYDYVNEQSSDDIYDKKNIDRKDGGLINNYNSHKQTDVNQLTPNFHDFLNLPVKYNPDKYVYPLISSSYASTKIQGSVNKFHNHKDTFGIQKTTTTKKPLTTAQTYFTPRTTQRTMATTTVTTTSTTTKQTTIKRYPELTTPPVNILNSAMSHPSFNEEYDYYDDSTTSIKPLTTQNVKEVYLTTPSTTTKKVMSLFEQLFGDYDETVTTTEATTTSLKPSTTTIKQSTTKPISITTEAHYPNIHAGPQNDVLTGSHMDLDNSYEYEEYSDEKITDNIAVENKVEENLSVEPLKPITKLTPVNKTSYGDKFKKPTLDFNKKPYNKYTTTTTTLKPSTYKPSTTSTSKPITTTTTTTPKPTATRVTSLPLGDNHIGASINRDPIIVATQNLREKLNSEKVKEQPPQLIVELPQQNQLAPSSSNIHIAPGQDTVSFVVGHHQSVGDSESAGQYIGTAIKESPFRPLQVELKPPQVPEVAGSAVTIQPLQNSEASLAIGMPVNGIKQIPGQVMDDSLDNDKIHFPKAEGTKVVFPEDKKQVQSNLIPPNLETQQQPNREVLKLNSKPMYHQLPSDLTPPKENDIVAFPSRYQDRPMRPPWDPRPGHFYSGKPEYARPPRPPPEAAYKRIDTLPNILPQFRPNMKHHYSMPPPYHYDQRFNRQPLLERPSNRPIGFFEKTPPHTGGYKRYPPPPKNIMYRGPPPPMNNIEERRPQNYDLQERRPQNYDLEERRPLAQQLTQSLDETNHQTPMAEDRIMNVDTRRRSEAPELNIIYQTPPNIHIANRRNNDGDNEVETLQMIQAKNNNATSEDSEEKSDTLVKVAAKDPENNKNSDKTIYKVYPVNTAPIIDVNEKNSEIKPSNFNYQKQDRNEAPILKPHPRPSNLPIIKSDFPYPLERPESTNNKLDDTFNFNNQWNSMVEENLESRIVNGGKSNQISATLKTYTEKPIAIAYTPTEPNLNADKYSMPNYGSPVIPEIRPGTVENVDTGYSNSKNQFTVHATMHTNPIRPNNNLQFNHKIDVDVDAGPLLPQEDFQAPFQASVNLDAVTNQGWAVVRDKNKTTTSVEETEATTLPLATTSEFDIENFKPQLIGGFKPIYTIPEIDPKDSVAEREEK